ncbi:MAG: hypothetical protein RQ751_09115 [Longimicrobiales bacterium]|nr:hypothetical protein [Longimicrobiales bacterium]
MNRMWTGRLARALLLLPALGLPALLSGQETAQSRARSALPPAVFQELERMGGEVERSGIPPELLFNKALEGAAKGVPGDRLLPAVASYSRRLLQAREMFGPQAGPPILVAGADALQRGVPEGALRRLGARGDRSPMAVLVLAELVEAGVPVERASDMVGEAMQRRVRQGEMLAMPEEVRRLMRQGRSAQDAAEQVQRAMRRGRGGGVGPPVPPGSEPLTEERQRLMRRRPGAGGV